MSGSQSDRSNGAGRCRWCMPAAVVTALFVFVPSASGGYGYTTPSIGSPIGPGTVPPSNYESGLVNTPNPMDSTTNLLMTGNVRGAKHFRGSVPYDSATSFGAPLGSTRLDSFLRYAAVPREFGEYPRNYSPFYSETGTMAAIPPGHNAVFAPTSPKVAGGLMPSQAEQPADMMTMAEIPRPQITPDERNAAADTSLATWQRLKLWPMSRTTDQMRDVIPDELADRLIDRRVSQPGNEIMTPEEYRRRLEQLQRELDRVKADVSSLEQTLEVENGAQPMHEPLQELQPRSLPDGPPRRVDVPQRPLYATPDHAKSLTSQPRQGTLDLLDLAPAPMQEPADGMRTDVSVETRWGLHDPPAGRVPSRPLSEKDRIDAIFSPRPSSPSDGDSAGSLPAVRRVAQTAHAYDGPARFLEHPLQDSTSGDATSLDRVSSTLTELRGASGGGGEGTQGVGAPSDGEQDRAEPNAAEPLIGDRFRLKYENAGSFSQERFERYAKAAELYLQQGRYYRAADSFTLASMYKPGDSRAYLGKSQALLAAGEYVSSALFLARALELDTRRTLGRTDLVEVLGGPDSFVRRISDLEETAADSDAPLLQFLLAYIYYQMDRPQAAQAAIEAAEKELPASLSLDLLKAAVGG